MNFIKTTIIITIIFLFVACGEQSSNNEVKNIVKKTNINNKAMIMPTLSNTKSMPTQELN